MVVVAPTASLGAHVVSLLAADPQFDVVRVLDRVVALLDEVTSHRPNLVVLVSGANGALERSQVEEVMALVPTPILVVFPDATPHHPATPDAFTTAGAVDTLRLCLPEAPPSAAASGDDPSRAAATASQLCSAARIVQGVAVVRHHRPRSRVSGPTTSAGTNPRSGTSFGSARVSASASSVGAGHEPVALVAIGASTGGPAALAEVLGNLGPLEASVLVVQHLHPDFVNGFLMWMQRVTDMRVVMAATGDAPLVGVVYLAPGGRHLILGADGRLQLVAEPVTLHRPSVDVLFDSLAHHAIGPVIGVLLTGIGDDGAAGLGRIRAAGGVTITQDRATSAVYGMPAAAVRLGASMQEVPLEEVAGCIRAAAVRRA